MVRITDCNAKGVEFVPCLGCFSSSQIFCTVNNGPKLSWFTEFYLNVGKTFAFLFQLYSKKSSNRKIFVFY